MKSLSGVVFLALFIVALAFIPVADGLQEAPVPTVEVDELFVSPLSHGEPGFEAFWEYSTMWSDLGTYWALSVRWSVYNDVECSPTPCLYILIVNEDYDNGRGWYSYDEPAGTLSNYSFGIYTEEWDLTTPGTQFPVDLYWTDQPPPYHLSDLLHLGTITQSVPLWGRSGDVINDDEYRWNAIDNTIVATFTITSVENKTGTTFEIRKMPYQWVPLERHPQILHDFPGPVCSFDWPSGDMEGTGCVDVSYTSTHTPFTAVVTVTAEPVLHWLWFGSGNETKCTPAIFETDGQESWWLSNTSSQFYCGPIPWYISLFPIVLREGP